jgi:hypothetical protein
VRVLVKEGSAVVLPEVEVEGVYFFNESTHGDAESLLTRTENLKDTDGKVLFVNAATASVVLVDERCN